MKATKLIAIFAIIAIISTGIVVAWCYDSDGGNKPFVRGFVDHNLTGNVTHIKDECFSGGVPVMNCTGVGCSLREGYCSLGMPYFDWYYNATSCYKGKLI